MYVRPIALLTSACRPRKLVSSQVRPIALLTSACRPRKLTPKNRSHPLRISVQFGHLNPNGSPEPGIVAKSKKMVLLKGAPGLIKGFQAKKT
ncbi:hypothetical protein J6590_078285 [Homalodisca vitripennis]|nr:hypothetical protein J6590_078285 [Homalodisca vitripennis]